MEQVTVSVGQIAHKLAEMERQAEARRPAPQTVGEMRRRKERMAHADDLDMLGDIFDKREQPSLG